MINRLFSAFSVLVNRSCFWAQMQKFQRFTAAGNSAQFFAPRISGKFEYLCTQIACLSCSAFLPSLAQPQVATSCCGQYLAIILLSFQVSNLRKRALPPFFRLYSEFFHFKNLKYLNLNA